MNKSDHPDKSVSLQTLIDRAKNTQQRISFEIGFISQSADPYGKFVDLVERAVDYSASRMAIAKNVIHSLNEDQLTYMLISFISGMGFDAKHSASVGGNCDIVIENDEMLWLGEAKIYTSRSKLFGGLRQLVDRYSTGLPDQNHGALIIYVKAENALGIMSKWHDGLIGAVKTISSQPILPGQLFFRTSIRHKGSGLMLEIKHQPIVLHHEPTDPLKPPRMSSGQAGSVGLGGAAA